MFWGLAKAAQIFWICMHAHTSCDLHGWDYASTGSKQRNKTFIDCIYLLGWISLPWSLLTCLHIQSGFSQPKLSSRTLHPHGQKCTHGPSTGWFGRGNNGLLVLDLSHPWGKAKGINTLVSRLTHYVLGPRALPREVMLSTNPNNHVLCTLLRDPRSTHSATLTSLLLESSRCFVSNTYIQRLSRNTIMVRLPSNSQSKHIHKNHSFGFVLSFKLNSSSSAWCSFCTIFRGKKIKISASLRASFHRPTQEKLLQTWCTVVFWLSSITICLPRMCLNCSST